MAGKWMIHGDLRVLTGLHIGGSSGFSAIGAVDSPVVRDKRTGWPIVPGSSLKGKLRALLDRSLEAPGEGPRRLEEEPEELLRLFGSARPVRPARLQVSDAFLKNKEAFPSRVDVTEVKFENAIDRITCQANPRQIERVVSGAVFQLVLVYREEDPAQTQADLKLLADGLRLLQIDYLGGHGSRGSGRVTFENLRLEAMGSPHRPEELLPLFQEVERYELLSV